MWNTSKPPSVRDLAARIDAGTIEASRIRAEQRELQAALEAEQSLRLSALNESARRVDVLTSSLNAMHDRIEELQERLELLLGASNAITARIDDLVQARADDEAHWASVYTRLAALEGDDIPAAPDDGPSSAASSTPASSGGDTTTEPEPVGDLLSSSAEDAMLADAPVAVPVEERA